MIHPVSVPIRYRSDNHPFSSLHHTTKTAKIKKVLLLRSMLTLWRRAAKVIAPFWFLPFLLCDVGRVAIKNCFKLLIFFKFITSKGTIWPNCAESAVILQSINQSINQSCTVLHTKWMFRDLSKEKTFFFVFVKAADIITKIDWLGTIFDPDLSFGQTVKKR